MLSMDGSGPSFEVEMEIEGVVWVISDRQGPACTHDELPVSTLDNKCSATLDRTLTHRDA